jgi:hypothetical protein
MVTIYLAPHFAWAAIPSFEDNKGVIVATQVNGLSYLDIFRAFLIFGPIFKKKNTKLEKFKNYYVVSCLPRA